MFRKIVRWGLGTFLALVAVFFSITLVRENRTFEAPRMNIRASADPRVIERGEYLVNGPGHCADCHGASELRQALYEGADVPLSGGFEFVLPVGTFRVPNITSDAETGIGRLGDEDIARVLRYGVLPDGRAALPFMPFADLSDEDLSAVISYLRTLKPVNHSVAPHEPNALGRVIKAFVLEPKRPSGPVPQTVPAAETPEYGRYLAHSVANCVGCHTQVDMRTGEFSGPLFAGGAVHESLTDPTKRFIAPNLTPDPRSGWLSGWSEDTFVARFKAGRVYPESPMPWQSFARMTESDLRALYRYLKTVPAAPGGPDPVKRDVLAANSTP